MNESLGNHSPLATFAFKSSTDLIANLYVNGELDMSNVEEFRQGIAKLVSANSAVCVDLTMVTFMDSHAVQAVFEMAALQRVQHFSATVVVAPNSVVSDLASLTRLVDVVPVVEVGLSESPIPRFG
jgi:anti-anti-sigma factor